MDRNPELSHMLNDPAMLQQTLDVARNPELLREQMRNTDRALNNIQSHPEGFNMLRRLYHDVQARSARASCQRRSRLACLFAQTSACDRRLSWMMLGLRSSGIEGELYTVYPTHLTWEAAP